MTERGHPIGEEDLHAYIDGQLDEERQAAVARYLEAHADVRERVGAYQAQRAGLRAALSARASAPIPPQLNLSRLVEARLQARRMPWAAVAAAMVALLVGGAGGWLLAGRAPTGIEALSREAAASYAVYATDKRRPVELSAAQRDDLTRWLSNRLERPVAPPDLSAAGYQLLGGRLVASMHGPAALFLYENATGTRLSIYVRPMSTMRTTPIEQVDIGPMDGCAWIDRGVGYSLVAAEPYDKLLEMSRHVREELQPSG